LESLVDQLKQRQVLKVATIYAVSAWPLIQIADLAMPALQLPDSVMTLLLQIFIAGFPVSLIFAWFFNFTDNGVVWARGQTEKENNPKVNFQTTVAVAGSVLLVFLITLGSQIFLGEHSIRTTKPALTASQTVPQAAPQVSNDSTTLSAGKKESIAILPFVPFSSDLEDEYFADGMVEELLNLLAKIPDLQVAARTSSFAYKGVSNKTIAQIGKELGVETILEGSIRKNDVTNKIRVTAQLIKVSTGEHLWSETYDREYRDIFQIQDDIARAVVEKMKVTLLGQQEKDIFVAETNNVDAMVAYGKGQKELAHRTAATISKALNYFQQAVALDSNYARAYVGIADANVLLAMYGNLSKQDAKVNAEKAVAKALTINNKLASAHASKGLIYLNTDKIQAEKSFQLAIELNPNYAMSYMWYGTLLRESGRTELAQIQFKKAFELDPRSPVAAFNVAWGYYQAGEENKAMELFSYIIANDPYYPGAYNLVGDILTNRGRIDQAINMFKRSLDVDPRNLSALKGVLRNSMDIGDKGAVEYWFNYIEGEKGLFSQGEIDLFQARYLFSQRKPQEAVRYFENVIGSQSMMGMHFPVEAEALFYKGEFRKAISAYEKLPQYNAEPDANFYAFIQGQIALHLAYAYQKTNQGNKANKLISGYENYLEGSQNKKANNPDYYYNMALIRALQSKKSESIYFIQGAIDAGWITAWNAEVEPIFANINQDAQFILMMGGVTARLTTMKSKMNSEADFLLADSTIK